MSRVVINEGALNRLMTTEDGPVGRYLAQKAIGVERRARARLAGHHRSGAAEFALRFAGTFRDARGLYVVVGTDATPRDQGRTRGDVNFQYAVPLETGRDPGTGRVRNYRYPFLEPALREEFGLSPSVS